MKNKKGFTLIEVIAAVIILGIISIVAVVTYTGSMKEFRDNYYTSLERTLVESGKEFFEDNRSYRPTSVFTAQKVPISILESKAYIDDITDYNGNKCDRSSYVIAIKAAKNDYIYHACLACSEDTYSNLDDKYCDSSWDDPTTVKPDLAAMEDAYVYKNTPQDKLREKLRTAVSITKFDREGNVVDSINGDGVDGIPEILPENIDIVDTSKVGTYTVTYKYNNKSVDRRVHVYENSAPEVAIYKTNVYAKKIVETTVTEETKQTTYSSGQWAQEVNIDFQPGSTFYSESGEKVTQYQWSKGGQWKNICDDIQPDGSCHVDYRQEMNEEVAFRVVDNEGNISKETIPLIIRVDKTDPSCSLKVLEGTPGKNDWYNSNIKIGFDVLKDQTSTVTEAKSGIEFNSIRRGTTEYNQSPRTSSLEAVHSDESQYVWYYGFVEDKAQNYARCSIKVRKDSVVPNCSITNHASLKCTDATSKLVKVYFGKTANSDEGDGLDYLSEWTSTGSVPSTGTWYLKAIDHSGLTSQISSNYYLVTYDKNGGNSGPTKTSEIKRETELADLTPTARKVAHKMIGWSTSKTATSAITSHTVTKDVTLYAVYQKCGTGYYTDAVGTACVQCPAGYRDGGPVGAIGDCQKKVTAGYFVDKANDANATVCAKGYYNGEHWVKYGQTSVCTQCPAGYRDGAAAGSQAGCAKSVAANYKVETAYGDASVCSTGYHSSPHTVTYGNISKCTINTYTLTYNNNSGSGCTNKTATHGSAWGKLCTPTRDGYDFKGWYTSASGGTAVTASTTASGNITVYAHWESSCTKVWKCNRETGGPGTYELWLTSCSGDYNYTVTGFKDNVSASSFDTGTIKTYHTGNQYYKCKNASGTCVQSFKYTCEHGNCSSTLYCAQGSCKVVCE